MTSISMKKIVQISHTAGAEPAGICVQMTAEDGEIISVFLVKDLVKGLRDLLQTALDEHLPKDEPVKRDHLN
jgi:hypothetical protein